MAVKLKISSGIFWSTMMLLLFSTILISQTPPNTQIINQAKAVYKFKSFPNDTIRSNTTLITVLEAPNFEMSFSNHDSLVFSKETLTVRLVYKNIGNQTADSATIEGILPPAGMKFVPGSTGGAISGNTVTWKVIGILPGKTDSVKVNVVVDSNLAANTQLDFQANINWQSSGVNASKIFVVSSFPRLGISISSGLNFVGSGREVTYTIAVKNTGNIPSTNTVVYDTISALGTFVTANINPDSMSANKRLIKWNLGTLPSQSTTTIILRVLTQPNLGFQDLFNSAFTFSSNVTQGEKAFVSNKIVPLKPASISIVPSPQYIFGRLNEDSSRIEVVIKDSTGTVMPDGVPVQFVATAGTFVNNQNSIATTVQDGKAIVYVRSINVANEIIKSKITAVGGAPLTGTIQDTTNIFLYPGAVTGIVVNGINRVPFQGAIARVFNQTKEVVGADTTKLDGKFFIALNKDVTKYTLEILVIDKFGDSIKTYTDIDPTSFPLRPIVIPNIISGRIEYKTSGEPVPAENVTVFLDSIGPGQAAAVRRSTNIRALTKQNVLIRVGEQKTDARGKFKFENLTPARYIISIDSVQFPNFTGFTLLTDTTSGTFTINLSLQISLDSSITFSTNAPALAEAGDTLTVKIGINNTGNTEHHNIIVTDTLSPFVRFVSATNGKFNPVHYDSSKRVVTWQRDTIKTLENDSLSLNLVVSRNIPDSTKIVNRFWFNSHILSTSSFRTTAIRSQAVLQFSNSFVVAKDTIIAGDSIRHVFKFKNTGTDSLRGIRIVDTLFSAGLSGISLAKSSLDSTKIVDSISTIYIGSIAPDKEDSVSLKLLTDFALRDGVTITSHAYVMKDDSILIRRDTTLSVNENPNLSSFLTIIKTGNKKVAEIGDIVTYQIQINNSSPQAIRDIGIYDMLPYAFKYVKSSARYNGLVFEPKFDAVLNQLRWTLPDTILSSKSSVLVYQLAIGADAMESEGLNTAYASAVAGVGTILVSAPSQWQVTVRPGVFTEKGLIIGKVFYDDNRNTFQDAGENGIRDIELWMEDGTKIITGDDGKFSLPEVKPGQHVMRINERTLPKNVELLNGNNAFAKDPTSRFVRVTEGGIAKANFYLKRNVGDSIKQSVGKINKLTSVRQAKPKYLYEDTLRNIRVDTVEMFVSFVYSGAKPLETIDIFDVLNERFAFVPNSATFNGRRINPIISENNIQWKLGRAKEVMSGTVKYKVTLKNIPRDKTILRSFSTIRTIASDSSLIVIDNMLAENIVQDVAKNMIETSEILTETVPPVDQSQLSDHVTITVGDEILIKTSLYIDPKKKIKSAKLLDSLESSFSINEHSFMVNGIPVASKNLSVKVRSSSLTSAAKMMRNELEFVRIASVNLTELLRTGMNEIVYSAKLLTAPKDTVYNKTSYALLKNEFDEENLIRSKDVKINVRAGMKPISVALETVYVDIPRLSVKVEEKVAEALKLVQSLKQTSTKVVVMEGITFELSKATLTKESKIVLDNVAQILVENPEIKIQINGYTDNTGNATANRRMSLNRAKEVSAYLISKGIDPKRLRAQGFGPNNPIASNKTEEGRTKNRRVEFARMK